MCMPLQGPSHPPRGVGPDAVTSDKTLAGVLYDGCQLADHHDPVARRMHSPVLLEPRNKTVPLGQATWVAHALGHTGGNKGRRLFAHVDHRVIAVLADDAACADCDAVGVTQRNT